MTRRFAAVLLAGLAVLAGVPTAGVGAQAAPPPDPGDDPIGWENGYWHNESIDVDQSDGLSAAEQEAYVARAIARVEWLREREFEHSVPVSVVSRDAFGNRTRSNASANFTAWNNQVWEALFIVGEDEDVQELLHSTATAQTAGGYFYATDEITIVADDPDRVVIDRRTLVHELVHALQDQYVDLTNATYSPATQDEQLATNGLIEGEANYIEARYERRCGNGWECVATPGAGGGGSTDLNLGIYLTLLFPYSDGPPYVAALRERQGWAAVGASLDRPPNSSEQLIHDVEEAPEPLSLPATADGGWEAFPAQGENGTDTVGEASIFAMLWYQARVADAATVDPQQLWRDVGEYDIYNYDAPASAGWANDAIRPYRKETPTGPAYGYVWTTRWDSRTDAMEFHDAYLAILEAHGARHVGPRTRVIDAGRFADAFRVVRSGPRVTIVNAPTTEDLDDVAPSVPAGTPFPTGTDEAPAPAPGTGEETERGVPGEATETPGQSGPGVVVALAAIVAALLAWARRRP